MPQFFYHKKKYHNFLFTLHNLVFQKMSRLWVSSVLSWLSSVLEYNLVTVSDKHVRMCYYPLFNLLVYEKMASYCGSDILIFHYRYIDLNNISIHVYINWYIDIVVHTIYPLYDLICYENMASYCASDFNLFPKAYTR